VTGFIARHGLDPDITAYYRGTFKEGPWYVLMYGIYPDREAALAGRNQLPKTLQNNKPWPRDLKSVHQAIRDAR
jgi:DamX protein